jgi:16S rRNA (guanine527-N7)-methyltransferase
MIISNVNVSRGEYDILLKYQSLLLKWNKSINLISKASENDLWERHINDSIQLLKYIDLMESVVDIGSGAGFPGIVLSIGGVQNVTLIESDTRKAVFLRQASKLSLNKINIIEERLDENFKGNYDILTCRGFSNITNILNLTNSMEIGKMLLLKGENYDKEIIEAKKHWLFNFALHDSITGNGKIVEISNIKRLL